MPSHLCPILALCCAGNISSHTETKTACMNVFSLYSQQQIGFLFCFYLNQQTIFATATSSNSQLIKVCVEISMKVKNLHMLRVWKSFGAASQHSVPPSYNKPHTAHEASHTYTHEHTYTHTLNLASYNGIPEGFNLHSVLSQEPDSGVQSVREQIYRGERLLGGMTVCVHMCACMYVCGAFCSCQYQTEDGWRPTITASPPSSVYVHIFVCVCLGWWWWGGYALASPSSAQISCPFPSFAI